MCEQTPQRKHCAPDPALLQRMTNAGPYGEQWLVVDLDLAPGGVLQYRCPPGLAGGALVGGGTCCAAVCAGLEEFLQHLRKHVSMAAAYNSIPAHGYYALLNGKVALDVVLAEDDPAVRLEAGTVYHLLHMQRCATCSEQAVAARCRTCPAAFCEKCARTEMLLGGACRHCRSASKASYLRPVPESELCTPPRSPRAVVPPSPPSPSSPPLHPFEHRADEVLSALQSRRSPRGLEQLSWPKTARRPRVGAPRYDALDLLATAAELAKSDTRK